MRSCLESDTFYIDVGRICRLYHIELHNRQEMLQYLLALCTGQLQNHLIKQQ